MMFRALASSSHGNAYLVTDKQTAILIECGVSQKKLRKLLGFGLTGLAGCLVSHEHKDHALIAGELARQGMEVCMSQGTAQALELEEGAVRLLEDMEQFSLGSFDIVPFATFHDAREPLGFLVKSRCDGEVLAFATDTVNLRYRFPGVTILAIEANYDKDILARCRKLPEKVQYRIRNTHMEIGTLCDYLKGLDLSNCREIHLLHLSDASSNEEAFLIRAARAVPPGIKIEAAPKER